VSQIPVLIPTSLLLTALLTLLAGILRPRLGWGMAIIGVSTSLVLAVLGLREVVGRDGAPLRYAMGNWTPPTGIEFVMDSLAAYMVVVILFMGVLAVIYAGRSLAFEAPGKSTYAYPAMVLVLAGLTGMCLTGDIFNLYVFLEIAALAAYALLAIGSRGAAVATFRYLLVGAVAGSFYLIGAAYLYFSTGTLNMADLYVRLPELMESRTIISAAIFMVVGLAVKMALFPMHFWLPDVYTHAPSAVTGLIAPIMTKVSAYAIIRLFLDVFPPGMFTEAIPLASTIGWLSAGGILFGSVMAVAQTDYRRMLAYSSVGQVAYVGLGIGLANPLGMIGGLLHILNHALMKGALFMIGGIVRHRTGATRVADMAGTGRLMPWTMAAFVIAALSMVGIPPTAGFFSKWYLILGALDGGRTVWLIVILLSSLLTAIYFFRMVEQIYREPEGGAKDKGAGSTTSPHPALSGAPAATGASPTGAQLASTPVSMVLPVLILAVAILGAGFMNVVIVNELLRRVVAPLAG